MRYLLKRLINLTTANNVKSFRLVHTSRVKQAYEGEGKTTVTFLSKDPFYGLMVKSANSWGFTLNTGTNVLGPMIIFPKSIVAWNVTTSADINEDSLCLFSVLEPKLDMVVIGIDDNCDPRLPTVKNIRRLLKDLNVQHEILPVEKAIGVFNFLNSDQRYIAAALIPPTPKELIARSTN